jgi:ABC-type amino acid transport substrate-binding protein
VDAVNAPRLKLVAQTPDQRIEALEAGELLVRMTRYGLTIAPDHPAIAKANRALRNWTVYANPNRDSVPSA